MSALTLTVQLCTVLACMVIFFRTEPVLNQMARGCKFHIRVAFWLLVVGSVGAGSAVLLGWTPPPFVAILLAGVALLLVGERRLRSIHRLNAGKVLKERRGRT